MVLTPGTDSIRVVYVGSDVAGLAPLYLYTGPFVGSQLSGLIQDDTYINLARQGLDHINVPHGQSCRLAQCKNHGR